VLTELNILVSGIAIVIAILFAVRVLKKSQGTKQMQFYSKAIQKGAMEFLKKEYEVIFIFALVVFALLSFFLSIKLAIAFGVGALYSGLAGFSAMLLATRANVRTTEAAQKSLGSAVEIAFSSSLTIGLMITGTGLLGVSLLYFIFRDTSIIYGFSLGASSIALFARVGGGIFTKAADIAADIVGKVELNITEDDPRNPAALADNVGDDVGDVAGMGADLFESYVGAMIATMALAALIADERFVILPMLISAVGIISSIMAVYILRKQRQSVKIMVGSFTLSGLLVIFFSLIIINYYLPNSFMLDHSLYTRFGLLMSIVSGVVAGMAVGFITKKYTYSKEKWVMDLAVKTKTGTATNILEGLSIGMRSTMPIILTLAVSILVSKYFASIYGVALSAVAMLSTLTVILAIEVFGPISDNAQGIAKMAKLNKKVLDRTGMLDTIGNTTAAIGKGFAVTSSAYTSLAFFFTYAIASKLDVIDMINPSVMVGALIGGMLAFLFSAMTIRAVGNTADSMIIECRRQFKVLKLLTKKSAVPDYNAGIVISTRAALREMIAPGLIAIAAPFLVGFMLGIESLAGMLAGCLVTSVLLGITMFNAGAAWDNAKKIIEEDNTKGETLVSAVIGDTVGDPLKDTAGPSMNILVKLVSIVSLIILPLLLKYAPLIRI
jgi:K(+)-stimulated pyrophosphate-energized sodium pump